MSADTAYLDSSSFVKLVSPEVESPAVEQYLSKWPKLASSALLKVEAVRAALRIAPEVAGWVRARLSTITLLSIDGGILELAALLEPPRLRSLDAIHLATARALGSDLGVVVTYDRRMAAAAEALGLPVASPA